MTGAAIPDRRDPWLGIELRHLAALSAIDSEGTFSEAALSLGYVQSAVSGQLAMLERLTGTRLVERSRGPGPQKLTPAGELLLEHSRDILGELETARARLLSGSEADPSGIRISVASSMADSTIGRLLTAMLANADGLELAGIITLQPDQILDALLNDDTDVAITTDPVTHDEVASTEIARHEPVLVVQADTPLARRRRPPTLEQLAQLPLIAWREGHYPSLIELELAEHGLTPKIVAHADTAATTARLVTTGLGAAVLPDHAIPAHRGLTAVSLGNQIRPRATRVAWNRTHSGDPRLRNFIDLAYQLREPA